MCETSLTFLICSNKNFSFSGLVRNSLCRMLISDLLTYSIPFSRMLTSLTPSSSVMIWLKIPARALLVSICSTTAILDLTMPRSVASSKKERGKEEGGREAQCEGEGGCDEEEKEEGD